MIKHHNVSINFFGFTLLFFFRRIIYYYYSSVYNVVPTVHVHGRNSAPVACRLLVQIYTREKNQFNIQRGNNRGEFSTPTYLKTHNIITRR